MSRSNLYVNWYVDKHSERQKEIEECFRRNLALPFLNVISIESQSRMKFSDFFSLINQCTEATDINVVCNSDIYFDDTLKLAEKIGEKECYALTRWNIKEDGSSEFFNRPDSQDVWIFRGPILNVYSDFYLGWRGCDNRLAFEINKAGYKVTNPSLSIKTHHLQLTNIRNYSTTGTDNLVPGPYLTLPGIILPS